MGRPNLILFVEDLTGLVSESLPDFWRLGQAYFSSTLFQVCACVHVCVGGGMHACVWGAGGMHVWGGQGGACMHVYVCVCICTVHVHVSAVTYPAFQYK